MAKHHIKLLFVYPPSADPTAPPLALARIKGAADKLLPDIYEVNLQDENRRFVKYVIDLALSEELQNWISEVKKLDMPPEYKDLIHKFSKGADRLAKDLLKSLGILKTKALFFDIDRYIFAYRMLSKVFQIFSLAYHPTQVSFATLRPAFDISRSEELKKALELAYLNPYLNYFSHRINEINIPDVAGISVIYTSQLFPALTFAKLCKERWKTTTVLLGGPCACSLGDVLQDRFSEFIDKVIPGDGEVFLRYLANQKIKDGSELRRLILKYGNGRNRDYFASPEFPIDFSWASIKEYPLPEAVIPIDITRGCYYGRCVFCQYGFQAAPYRTMRPSDVVSTLARIKREFGVNKFFFSVDAIDPDFLTEVCERLISANLSIDYCIDARLEKRFCDEKFVRRLSASGCKVISFGMESACQETLKAMRKGTESAHFAQILKNLKDANIHVQVHLIHGFPGEKASHIQQTLQFLRSHQRLITTAGVSSFALLVGAPIEKELEKYGISEIKKRGDLSLEYDYERDHDRGYPDYETFRSRVFELFPVVGRLTGSTTDYLLYASCYSPAYIKRVLRNASLRFT